MSNLGKLIYLTEAQKLILFANGTITVGTQTVTYSDDDMYLIQQLWSSDGSSSECFYIKDGTDTVRLSLTNSGILSVAGFSGSGSLLTNINVANIAGSTLVGQNLIKLANPSALSFIQIAADNSVSTVVPNTAFNKNFGTTTGTVAEGHLHPYRANTWVPSWADVTGKIGSTYGSAAGTFAEGNHNHTGIYEPVITKGTTSQYFRGDMSLATMPTTLPASDVYAWAKASVKPTYTSSEVGLGNVANESKATMFASPTFTGTVANFTVGTITGNITGNAGYATNAGYLNPGIYTYTDTMVLYILGKVNNTSGYGATGLYDAVYIQADGDSQNNVKLYAPQFVGSLTGTASGNLTNSHAASGVTATKILNWDTAYAHSQAAHAPSTAQKNSDITKAEIEAKLTGAIISHTHAYRVDTWVPNASDITGLDSTHRWLTDSYISTWNSKLGLYGTVANGDLLMYSSTVGWYAYTPSITNWNTAYTAINAATNVNTVSTIVKRDASGNFSAGTITASLTGHASLDLPLTGGTLTGTLTGIAFNMRTPKVYVDNEWNLNLGTPTLQEMATIDSEFTNKTDFYPSANITYWTSPDGAIWTDVTSLYSDIQKGRLWGGDIGSTLTIPNGTAYFKVQLVNTDRYCYLNAIYMQIESRGNNHTRIQINKRDYATQVWSQHIYPTTNVTGWPTHAWVPMNLLGFHYSAQYDAVSLIFITSSWDTANDYNIQKIQIWGGYPGSDKRNIYATDYLKNVTFPSTVNATTFIGSLTGIASGNLTSASSLDPSKVSQTTSYRFVTDTEKSAWNAKQNALTNPVTGTGTANELVYWSSTSTIGTLAVATYPSLTELAFVKGVTSAIQTQINGKSSSSHTHTGIYAPASHIHTYIGNGNDDIEVAGNLEPTDQFTIGDANSIWWAVYANTFYGNLTANSGDLTLSSYGNIICQIEEGCGILPPEDSTGQGGFTLGNSTHKFERAFINTVYGNSNNGAKANALSVTNGVLKFTTYNNVESTVLLPNSVSTYAPQTVGVVGQHLISSGGGYPIWLTYSHTATTSSQEQGQSTGTAETVGSGPQLREDFVVSGKIYHRLQGILITNSTGYAYIILGTMASATVGMYNVQLTGWASGTFYSSALKYAGNSSNGYMHTVTVVGPASTKFSYNVVFTGTYFEG